MDCLLYILQQLAADCLGGIFMPCQDQIITIPHMLLTLSVLAYSERTVPID